MAELSTQVGEEVSDADRPKYLPEGWKAIRYYNKSGDNVGKPYLRFFKSKHRGISSIRRCIESDCEDLGIDPGEAIEEYEMKSSDIPHEFFGSFRPEDSGLSSDQLQALPEDTPPKHMAFKQVKVGRDAVGKLRAAFNCGGSNMQVAQGSTHGNLYAACRIARALYRKHEEGLGKEDVAKIKKDWIDRFVAAMKESGDLGAQKAAKPKKKRKENTSVADERIELHGTREESKPVERLEDDSNVPDERVKVHGNREESKPTKRRKDDSHVVNANAKTEIALQEQPAPRPTESSASEAKNTNGDKDGGAASIIATQAAGRRDANPLEDAPPGHLAYERCKIREQTNAYGGKNDYCRFSYKGTQFQVTVTQAGDNAEECLRIARLCFIQLENGATKEELALLRNELCAAALAGAAGTKVSGTTSTKTGQLASAKKKQIDKQEANKSEDDSASKSQTTDSDRSDEETVNSAAIHRGLDKRVRVAAKMMVRCGYYCRTTYKPRL